MSWSRLRWNTSISAPGSTRTKVIVSYTDVYELTSYKVN
jgi:hypothetical protein